MGCKSTVYKCNRFFLSTISLSRSTDLVFRRLVIINSYSPILFLVLVNRDSTTFYCVITFFSHNTTVSSDYEIRIKNTVILSIVSKTTVHSILSLIYNHI